MAATYDFLDALGLDEDALERDIRRAYARRLKSIDQEHDPDGFQHLRAVYEEALDWAAWKQREDEAAPPATASATEPAAETNTAPPSLEHQAEAATTPAPAPDDPHTLGQAAFQLLAAELDTLAAQPAQDDAQPWKDALRRRLDDDGLINIDARVVFEAIIAAVLAHGWRPGHESLFVAALEVFGWDEDPRRLLSFGHGGPLLDRALAERRMFATQSPAQQAAMRRAARALRSPAPPTTRGLRESMRTIETMMARFPSMMRLVVSLEQVEQWRAAYRAKFNERPVPAPEIEDDLPAPKSASKTLLAVLWRIARNIALLVLTAFVLHAVFEETSTAPRSQQVSQAILDAHLPALRYQLPPGSKPGRLETSVQVFLDDQRRVERTRNLSTSGDPGFDEAVAEALRAATPFPPGTPAQFDVDFSLDASARAATSALAPAVRPPAPTTPDAALLSKHIGQVDYQPTRYAQEGKLSLHYRVRLNDSGIVQSVEQIEGSGEPRLDHAFENALRAAKPFPESTARSFDVTWSTVITRKPPAGG